MLRYLSMNGSGQGIVKLFLRKPLRPGERKSHINSVAIGTQAVMAIHPLPLERGILAFSRKRVSKKVIPNRIEFILFFLFSELVLQLFEHFENLG